MIELLDFLRDASTAHEPLILSVVRSLLRQVIYLTRANLLTSVDLI